jgi:hypothetical protein
MLEKNPCKKPRHWGKWDVTCNGDVSWLLLSAPGGEKAGLCKLETMEAASVAPSI